MASAAPSTSKNQIRRDVKEVHAARMDLPVRRSAKQRRQDRILRLKEYVGWLVMLPLCMLSLMAFMELLLKASLRGGLLTSGECQWFAIGAIIWLGMFVTARRWFVILYVFAHEMTHLFTARLFRAKIYGWHVGWDGGWVDTNKSNCHPTWCRFTRSRFCWPLALLACLRTCIRFIPCIWAPWRCR